MPIIDLQRRLREAGRIRLGDKGGRNGAPRKLGTFRLTGPDEKLLQAAADVFGGTVEPWPEMDGQYQVTTDATSMDVIIPPTEMAHSVWYEQWSGGGCQRRCDGTWDTITDRACDCNPEDRACKPHTRLSVMLTALPGIGVWRLDTQGWNAATELQGAVDMIQQVAARGTMLPARLLLVRREQKVIVGGKPQTRKFVVPALDVDVQMTSLGAGAPVAAAPALSAGVAELEAGPGFTKVPESVEAGPSIAEQVVPPEPAKKKSNAAAPIPGSGRSRRKPPAAAESAEDPDPDPSSSHSPESSGSGPDRSDDDRARAQRIAMWCADAGFETDEDRHRFLAAWSEGAVSSSYDVPVDDLGQLRGVLKRVAAGEVLVVDEKDGPVLVKASDRLVTSKAAPAEDDMEEPF